MFRIEQADVTSARLRTEMSGGESSETSTVPLWMDLGSSRLVSSVPTALLQLEDGQGSLVSTPRDAECSACSIRKAPLG